MEKNDADPPGFHRQNNFPLENVAQYLWSQRCIIGNRSARIDSSAGDVRPGLSPKAGAFAVAPGEWKITFH